MAYSGHRLWVRAITQGPRDGWLPRRSAVLLLVGLSQPAAKGHNHCCGILIGVYACQKATDAIGIDDHGGIVWDEFVGMFITVACLPNTLAWLIAGFVVFRIFDIWKPWPIGPIDAKLKGGLGIMLDDVIAGVFALVVLKLIEVTFF